MEQSGSQSMHPSFLNVIAQRERIKKKLSGIKHKIGVYSAKGGVGKTTVAVNLAYALNGLGYKVGLLDADIDCPNVNFFTGMEASVMQTAVEPMLHKGVKVLSTALFTDDAKRPIIWRGPLIAKMVAEFLENADWGALDYLIVDLPPGTSDAPLSIMQLLDLDGIVLVTTPQKIAAINASRSGLMAKRLGVAILGIVETMSLGNPANATEISKSLGAKFLGSIKFDVRFNKLSDEGKIPVLEEKEISEEFMNIIKNLDIKR
ncbi:MAG: P-loop NTPase [Candidatus Micrarchaeaceae archaeon]